MNKQCRIGCARHQEQTEGLLASEQITVSREGGFAERTVGGSAWSWSPTRASRRSLRPGSCGSGCTALRCLSRLCPQTAPPDLQSPASRPPAHCTPTPELSSACDFTPSPVTWNPPRPDVYDFVRRSLLIGSVWVHPQVQSSHQKCSSEAIMLCMQSGVAVQLPHAAKFIIIYITNSEGAQLRAAPGEAPFWCRRGRAPSCPTCVPAGRPC